MKNKILSLLLILVLIFSLLACGEYRPPVEDDSDKNENVEPDSGTEGGGQTGTEERGEPFVATVMLNGKPYTPPEFSDDSLSVKVRWTDGKTYHTSVLGKDGRAECYGLDGEYSVTLVNLPTNYTYNPNVYTVNNDSRDVIIELLTISSAIGDGTDVYNCIGLSGPGVYRAKMDRDGQEIFYEFEPTKPGTYCIESMMDISAGMYNPIVDIYAGSFAYKVRERRIDGGGASSGYTTNFRYVVEIDEAFIGNVFTFAVLLEGKDAVYPTNVDFAITYEGGYNYDWIVSGFVFPEFIPNNSTYSTWYSDYLSYLAEDRVRFGDANYNIASVRIDGKNVFDQQYFKLNPDDGYYHVFDAVKYAEYGGWGPIIYANITIPTPFIDTAFNTVEYVGNKALTVSGGTENYKLFIEGYSRLVQADSSYFCIGSCQCLPDNGGMCPIEDNCKKCTDDCRHINARYEGQRGYADIAIEGRCPVTEELKSFLQKYSVNQKLFSDGNGWAEQHEPRYDAYEDSQWLFACGYYSN